MKNSFALLAVTAAIGLAASAPAYAADEKAAVKSSVDYKKDGGYEATRTSEQVSAGGTKTTSKAKVDVDVDSQGRIDKTEKAETTTDPKGLMNKKQDTSKTEIEEKDRGGYKQTTTTKHIDASGTNITYKTVTDVDVDADGNVTTTAKTEKTVDPKGLMNADKVSSTTKAVNGKVVSSTTKD